ncbi:unnamed protein product [Auanema sp. JU1783]|nr:unnamed protein product [Auanema sp. JU1783]
MAELRVDPRVIYEFVIRAGARLDAQNKTVCSAIMILYRLYKRTIMDSVCNYTMAAAALMISSKYEEDNSIGIRDIVNATYRILHPNEERMTVGALQWDIRQGITRLEFVLLRELNFNLEFEHPFKILALYLDQLRSWVAEDFEREQIASIATAICRDLYAAPDVIVNSSPESLAITCISISLKYKNIEVPHCRNWYEVLHKTMTKHKLQRLTERIMVDVYKANV